MHVQGGMTLEIVYENIKSASTGEPRIKFIKTLLESILQLVDLEYQGDLVNVDGFRLKNLNLWKGPFQFDLWSLIGSPSSVCNLSCEFCFEKGNPPAGTLPSQMRRPYLSLCEAKTRASHFSTKDKIGLFPIPSAMFEPFSNPQLIEILEIVRDKSPYECIRLLTNGSYLTEETIKRLAELKPLIISVSLNSANSSIRSRVMNDSHPEIAINSLKLLKKYGIQYMTTLVAWPSISLQDIKKTLEYMDENEPFLIKVYPPGYTKYTPPSAIKFDTVQYWKEIVSLVKDMRRKIETPILIDPALLDFSGIEAIVLGVVKNSPAYKSGIRYGDYIKVINGKAVSSMAHAKQILKNIQSSKFNIELIRDGETITLEIYNKPEIDTYPYKPLGYKTNGFDHPYGICFSYALRLSYLNNLSEIIKKYSAKNVLLLSSAIVAPVLQEMVNSVYVDLFRDVNLYIN